MAAERKTASPPRRSAARQRRALDKETGWSVEWEIDTPIRVSEAELLVLETYLGKQLDALFGGDRSSRRESIISDQARNPPMRKRR
jgi:hypothetical protein